MAPAFSQTNTNMTKLAHWDDNSLPVASPGGLDLQYSGCWGITVKGREYAVLGGAFHVLFFDITKPDQPKMVGKFEGKKNTIWREFKSYSNRIYAVSDGTDEGLMIFDMSEEGNFEYLAALALLLQILTLPLLWIGMKALGRDFMLRRTAT